MSNSDAPENKDPEAFGMTLFKEDQQGWSDVFAINNHSIFFVSSAFVGLLAKGAADYGAFSSSIINITSISGTIKVAQDHVRSLPPLPTYLISSFISSLPILLHRVHATSISALHIPISVPHSLTRATVRLQLRQGRRQPSDAHALDRVRAATDPCSRQLHLARRLRVGDDL